MDHENNGERFSLANLISPIDLETFLQEYKDNKAIYIPGGEGRFGELFSWEDINHYLSFSRPGHDGARLIFEKKSLPGGELARISEWLMRGATLAINSVDQIDPIVSHLGSVLARDLNRHININCYASCPSKQGFDTHYDRHDVFIVATEGEKEWKVFDPTYIAPLERQAFDKGGAPDIEPYLECVMSRGDVMYIPRGHWHYAVAKSPSVHLTVGPHSGSGIDFLAWFVDILMPREEILRADFPVAGIELLGGDRSDKDFDASLDRFRQRMIEIFEDRVKMREFVMQYCLTTIKERRTFRLPEMALLGEKIEPRTQFTMNTGQKFVARYDPEINKAVITIKGHILELNDVPLAIVETLLNSEGTVSGEMLANADGSVPWESIRSFLILLCERGVISPA